MALVDRPLLLLTDGSPASLAALPQVAAFAAALGVRVDLLRLMRRDGLKDDDGIVAALANLPPDLPQPNLLPVAAQGRAEALAELARSTGGILVPMPQRRRTLGRMLPRNAYQRIRRAWPAPVLALPSDGRMGQVARILFPADLAPRSDAALDEALALCRRLGAELHILHVFGEDQPLPSERDQARRAAARSPRELLQIDQERIRELAERAAAQGVQATVHTAEGRAHANIISYAAANAIDLIVMPSHGPRTTEDILRGSTAVRVVHGAPAPVLVYRSRAARPDALHAAGPDLASAVGAAIEQA